MLSSDSGVAVGDLSPRLSQYLAARGLNPASVESFDCVSPASVRAARNCLPEAMLVVVMVLLRPVKPTCRNAVRHSGRKALRFSGHFSLQKYGTRQEHKSSRLCQWCVKPSGMFLQRSV